MTEHGTKVKHKEQHGGRASGFIRLNQPDNLDSEFPRRAGIQDGTSYCLGLRVE